MTIKPMLNLGAGRVILPCPRPVHHALVDEEIYTYPTWWNVDRNCEPGIDQQVDLFTYPFPFEDNQFAGALASHIVEHIPHEIRISEPRESDLETDYELGHSIKEFREHANRLKIMQDGWYAFFAELYRVLEPGAIVHILAPYGWSQGAITDPTHTRLITEHTFTHSMQPDPNSPFKYETGGIHFMQDEPAVFNPTQIFAHIADDNTEWIRALQTRLNVAYELYVKLRVVK